MITWEYMMESNEKINILLVDDRPENLLTLKAVLASPAYNLITANCGEEALKCVLKDDFAVILLDVQMPGINGFETAKLIKQRENSRHIPIIFITAISQATENVNQGYSVGAVDYIFKPFNAEILKSKVHAFVTMYQYQQQINRQSEALIQRSIELEHINNQLVKTTTELRKAEALARVAGDITIDTILTIDQYGAITTANTTIEDMFGYSQKEVVGIHVDNLLPNVVMDQIANPKKLKICKGKTFEVTAVRQNKTTFWADVQLGDATVDHQRVYVIFIRDITERKQMEDQLKQHNHNLEGIVKEKTKKLVMANKNLQLSHERFQKIFIASPSLMAIRSLKDGRFIDANESWLRYTGYEHDEVINQTVDLLQISSCSIFEKVPQQNLDLHESIRNARIRYITKSGSWRDGLLSTEAAEIHGEQCVISVITDITDREQLEKEIARLDRLNLIGEMAAGIAHEVRNPMTTVSGFLQIAKSKDESQIEYVDLMLSELNRANDIISEFLTLAKNKKSDLKLQCINKIIEALFPLIQAEALLSNKIVLLQLTDCPEIYLDEKEIRQMVLNIALNGIEAMSIGGELMIKTYDEQDAVVLEIKDQGNGIEPEVLEKIGTPFFTTKDKGTGMGLAVCYSVAARHNADIDIQTSQEGTAFYIRFKKTK
ncbi:PAS domain S-box protein [Bacillus sp. Marseille-P3661]|uniref:PAS domain S-box protein n=1 Tax=Bacillus sp. Marseille-P3661 TaxID=1936234 RepID=UPI002155AF54|nr:PAS domain S-box protein [Bacillus sp. Marseille-P3661]